MKYFMLPSEKTGLTKISNSVTWKSDWIVSPHESIWGILEKFKYANAATFRDIFQIFGIEKVRNNTKIWGYKTSRELYEINSIDESLLFKYLYAELKTNNEEILNGLARKFYFFNNFKENFFSSILRTCPECMKNGFHSIYHQISVLDTCPYHEIKLMDKCPVCNREHYYEISDKNFQSAFQCVCGYFYGSGEMDYNFTKKWSKNYIGKTKDNNLLYWLDMKKEQEHEPRKVYFDNKVALSKGTEFFKYINTVNDVEFRGDQQVVYIIQQYDKLPVYYNELASKLKNISYRSEITKHLMIIYKKTYKTIARFIRNHIIKEHKFCINSYISKKYIKLIEDGNVCPYAYAYVMWRQSIENLDNFWYVHRKYKARKYCPPGWDEHHLLYEMLINVWNNYYHELNSENLITLFSAYQKIISNLIINHYVNWIQVTESTLNEGKKLKSYAKLDPENIPFYYILMPEQREGKGKIEIRYWISELQEKFMRDDVASFNCPYKTMRQKKLDKGDLTYKAIRLPDDFMTDIRIKYET